MVEYSFGIKDLREQLLCRSNAAAEEQCLLSGTQYQPVYVRYVVKSRRSSELVELPDWRQIQAFGFPYRPTAWGLGSIFDASEVTT
jgi:hypothetical protein